jgi:hypothetical protein
MPVSKARRNANDAYNAKCDYISLRPIKADGTAIRAAAAAAGQSLQGYVLQAVRERMTAEGQPLTLEPEPKSGEEGGL